jgi:hypothetical protein
VQFIWSLTSVVEYTGLVDAQRLRNLVTTSTQDQQSCSYRSIIRHECSQIVFSLKSENNPKLNPKARLYTPNDFGTLFDSRMISCILPNLIQLDLLQPNLIS